ncbi:ribosomal protein L7/L12 C-terminal domain-containing protein [Blastocladiella britannica]|nr:ribosomal protein L7/L12 C-terminal domain-containing protein [Blastocladiella britannica]
MLRTTVARFAAPALIRPAAAFVSARPTAVASLAARRWNSDKAPATPAAAAPHIATIVDSIAKLTLAETADLVSLLKTRLNISDVAVPVAAAPAAAAPSAAVAEEEKPAEKVIFTVKLEKFDAAQKAKVIKEIKAMNPTMNLVEAKKFVEGAPKVVKENITKDEAEKIKKALEAAGATVAIE